MWSKEAEKKLKTLTQMTKEANTTKEGLKIHMITFHLETDKGIRINSISPWANTAKEE